MGSRSGMITTIVIVVFCIFVGLGVMWYFIREATDDVSTLTTNMYPTGVYNINNLSALNVVLYTFPFFAIVSLIFFTYISIKKRNNV